jgi:endoglucanase
VRHQTKLVLSPHVYGHGDQAYMSAADFPNNMPAIWDTHWGRVPEQTGTPVWVGEWGGVWVDAEWRGNLIASTQSWQHQLQDYLKQKGIGFFCAPPIHTCSPCLLTVCMPPKRHKSI